MKQTKLTIELVPRTCFYKNLRSELPKEKWDKLRKETYKKAEYKCEICGGKGSKHPVECHEIWSYDDENLIQKLVGLVALCPQCHQVKHIGLAQIQGNYQKALKHLMKVNEWTKEDAEAYIQVCFEIWANRSGKKWESDISFLEEIEA